MENRYMTIEDNIHAIRAEIEDAALKAGRDPKGIRLMAVTKTQTPEAVNAAIAAGIDLLGENRAQELNEKYDSYSRDGVDIHFIGHLQTNKVRQIADKVTMIHSVDSLRLAKEIESQAVRLGKVMDVLIEVNIAGELSKDGIAPSEVEPLAREIAQLGHLNLCGLMTIPPICDQESEIEGYFSRMQQLFVDIGAKKIDNVSMNVLSMGMSGDYLSAVKYGATLLRLGTAIFGTRMYQKPL